MRRVRTLLATFAVGLAAFTGASVTPASAAVSPAAGSGFTRVAIDPDVAALLEAAGISLSPTGKATAGPYRGTVAAEFPITAVKKGGTVIKHTGGLTFAAGSSRLSAKNFTINTKQAEVSAVVNGSAVGDAGRVALFTLSDSTMPKLGDFNLALTAAAADAFNATFGDGAVHEGDVFGYATVKP